MTKDEAVSLLVSNGFNAQLVNGSVEIVSEDQKDFEKGKKILRKAGYSSSYGWKKKDNPA